MSDYVSLEEMKNTLELANLTYKDDELREAITAASRSIDNYCGRIFASGGTADVRYYTANNYTANTTNIYTANTTTATYLNIDDLVTLTSLKTDYDGDGVYETTWTQGTDFVLEPVNAPSLNQPYSVVKVLYPRTSLRLPPFVNGVQVTGQFGWGTLPAPVKRATRILAARFVKRGDAPFGVVGFGFDGASMRIPQVDPDLHFLLDPYVKGGGVMVA